MRLAIAVSVLAQLLHHVDGDVLAPSTTDLGASNAEASDEPLTLDLHHASDVPIKHLKHEQKRKKSFNSPNLRPLDGYKPTWSNRISDALATAMGASENENQVQVQECDPQLDEEEADVGILSCGMNRHCVKSEASKRGGFCVENSEHISRGLQSYIDSCNTPPEGFSCDCSGFVDGIGSIICASDRVVCRYPGICGIEFYTVTYNTDGTYDLDICFDFTSTPRDLFCYGFAGIGNGAARGCFLDVDNIDCTCSLTDCPVDSSYEGLQGFIFDCTSTPANSAGNTCDADPILPLFFTLFNVPPFSFPDSSGTQGTDPPASTTQPPTGSPSTDTLNATPVPTNMPMTIPPTAAPTPRPIVSTPAPIMLAPTDMPTTGNPSEITPAPTGPTPAPVQPFFDSLPTPAPVQPFFGSLPTPAPVQPFFGSLPTPAPVQPFYGTRPTYPPFPAQDMTDPMSGPIN